ncbi:MAG: dihydroorotate dehydrogenase [Candidatus Omnitrophica bacterium]|nr:dihydroorotate dehydrogenase [Candidatus Omnitrophota bacterium]
MVRPKTKRRETDLSVKIGRIKMKNPVMVASGTFGYGKEYEGLMDISRLGAIVTKTITNDPRSGNPPPRVVETPFGMLNSIGLENDGVDAFIEEKLPYLRKLGIPVIVSIGGEEIRDFARLAKRLNRVSGVAGLEINISCPNIRDQRRKTRSRRLFSQDKNLTFKIVKSVRRATGLTIITKLTPNVTDVAEIARAAQDGGSDALSLVNTYMGMALDISTRKPLLGNVAGGLSGPAIKPLALKAVWDVYNHVSIPIIGMGGIVEINDVLEFLICGATAVALGTTNFVYPNKSIEIIDGLKYYIKSNKLKSLKPLIGSLKT